MKISVLDAASLGDDLDLSVFASYGELEIWQKTEQGDVGEHLRGARVAILNKVRLDAQALTQAPDLKLICEAATGFDNIDLVFCRAHGIAVCNVVGYSTQCVAQLTVTMALSLITKMEEYTSYVRDGRYSVSGVPNLLTPVYHEIAGKTWGVIGYGNIGRQVAKVAEALGCRVLVHKRTPVPDRECVSLDEICSKSDILSIHCSVSESGCALGQSFSQESSLSLSLFFFSVSGYPTVWVAISR